MNNKKTIINIGETTIGIIGLGYVGFPLAVEFGKKYHTVGYDRNKKRVKELKEGFDRTLELTKKEIKLSTNLNISGNIKDISKCNVFIVTVPTPVDEYMSPDMSFLASATRIIGGILKKGDIIIYESTVYPGATEEFCVPILEKESKFKFNIDFFCGYSPERINPGDNEHTLTRIKKITSGSNQKTAEFIDKLYKSIIPAGTYKVKSIKIAEAAKVIENIQRDVNIALINEFSMIFDKLDIDTIDVLEAAGTKWNFIPFRPGIVGGHCIGVDPYYLTHKAKEVGYHPEMILAGRRINDSMGKYIADSTIEEITKAGINPIGAKIAVLGLTFKENCPDLRNTKVPDIINQLLSYGCNISVSDPFADVQETKNIYNLKLVDKNKLDKYDAIIVAVAHDQYKKMGINDWKRLFNGAGVFIDLKGISNKKLFSATNILYWRL